MHMYKRKISDINQAQALEFFVSNNLNTYLNLTAFLECKKPYHGIYIRKNKIMVQNVFEKIQIGTDEYNIANFSTLSKKYKSYDYITKVDLKNYEFTYDVDGFIYTKCFDFIQDQDILYIDYSFKNTTDKNVKVGIIPLITYRDLFFMKEANLLKFNQRPVDSGYLFNLSVKDGQNLVIKAKNAKYNKSQNYLKNVTHEYVNKTLTKEIYTEDLYIPGVFEINIKPNQTKNTRLYFASNDFDIKKYNNKLLVNDKLKHNENITKNIKEQYSELKDLVLTIDNFDMQNVLFDRIPYTNLKSSDIVRLIYITRSIEGQYITLSKFDKAYDVILRINEYIKIIDSQKDVKNEEDLENGIRLSLWLVETINRLVVKDDKYLLDLFDITKSVIDKISTDVYKNKSYYLENIDIAALWYNALKIYQDFEKRQNISDDQIFKLIDKIKKEIIKCFWCEDKHLMKQNIKEQKTYATVDMIYVLSLSFQCVFDDIPIKLLDSIFKELYTPYGLRKMSQESPNSDLCVYPMYMAHFVKANLRQNGVTLASQKIAYNLVKELMQDIGKYINGGIKKVYSEKGLNIDYITYDLYTNAEMIRLYDMLM